eukprot:gene7651-10413_t
MSDDEEYEYDYGSDQEYNYGSDDGNNDNGVNDELIEIENAFYEGDDLRNEDRARAIDMFEKVVRLETDMGDTVKWRFKALQHLVTIYFASGAYEKMIERYRGMLLYIGSVTRNECTDSINIILDTLANSTDVKVLSEMYEITLIALKSANNERLWFNTNLKLAKLYLEGTKFSEVDRLISVLKKSCQTSDGKDDPSKGTYLLEVYCLEIQLCSVTHNAAKMRQIYPKTMNLNAAVADPRIMGVIREEGGKMQMSEGNWEEAYNQLYEAFRFYQEAGNPRARDCLKYVVVASMMVENGVNPFAAREAKVFAEDKEIIAMSDLRQCLEENNLSKFEKTINNKQNRIVDEPYLMTYIQPLRRRMREQVLLNLLIPYNKVTLSFLGRELSLNIDEVEALLVDMILDEKINASINQTNGHVIIHNQNVEPNCMNDVVSQWAKSLSDANENISNRVM